MWSSISASLFCLLLTELEAHGGVVRLQRHQPLSQALDLGEERLLGGLRATPERELDAALVQHERTLVVLVRRHGTSVGAWKTTTDTVKQQSKVSERVLNVKVL